MQQNNARRASIVLGVFMAIVLVAGAILPLLSANTTTTAPPVEPTDVPTPTFPAPVTNFETIAFDSVYLHPSGQFTIALPTGFTVTEPNTNTGIAQVNMRNDATLGVIDAYIEKPLVPVATEDLSARFTRETLAPTWSRFPSWQETNRRIDNDRLIMDFQIAFSRQNYVARQEVWTDGQFIYSVRVLTPDNAVDYLRHLLTNLAGTLQPLSLFASTPFEWQVYHDTLTNLVVRRPLDWTLIDGGVGRPTTFSAPNGVTLRLETRPNAVVGDETAAAGLIDTLQRGAAILTTRPVTRGEASGYAITYSYQTLDGEPFSGQAVLLNQTDAAGATAALLIANLRFPGAAVDLNTVDPTLQDPFAAQPAADATPISPLLPGATGDFASASAANDPRLPILAAVMDTIQVIEPLPLAASVITPTPTPLPSITPTSAPVETTPDATPDAETTPDATPDAETTPDATPDAGA